MKYLFTLFLSFAALQSSATHWLTCYIYTEQEYLQGPWIRATQLEVSNYKYLSAEVFEDLLGSEPAQLAGLLITRLRDQKPKFYSWKYELTLREDTVIISAKDPIHELETVQNEVIATLLFNGFKAVMLQEKGEAARTLTLDDLTLPYFDLVTRATASLKSPPQPKVIPGDTVASPGIPTANEGDSGNNWLFISGFANLILATALVIVLMKRKQSNTQV